MRVAVACLLCLALTSVSASYWSIDLTPKRLKDNGVLRDIVYNAHAGYKTGEIFFDERTMFDLTSHENFALSSSCDQTSCLTDNTIKLTCNNPCLPKIDSSSYNSGIARRVLASGRVELLKSDRGSDEIQLQGQNFEDIPILFNSAFTEGIDQDYIPKYVRSGFGLAYVDADIHPNQQNHYNNFIKQVHNRAEEVEKQQVSFYFGQNIERLMFGDVEQYFAASEFETFRNINRDLTALQIFGEDTDGHTDGLNLWSLDIEGISVASQYILNTDNTYRAFFDSTSSFIYVHNEILKDLVTKVNGSESASYCIKQTDKSVVCNCHRQNGVFPEITFTFKNDLEKDGKSRKYTLKPEQYLIQLEKPVQSKDCLFVFRDSVTYSDQHSLPNLGGDKEYNIWLGTSFLSAFYVAFDQTNGQIHIADAYQAEVSALHFDETFKYALIVLGLALFLGSTAIILSILRKVQLINVQPKQPQTFINSPVQIAPVQTYGYIPQQQPIYTQNLRQF